MKLHLFPLVVVLLLSSAAIAQTLEDVPRISAQVAYQKFMKGNAVLVDAMKPETHAVSYIPGSINIPNDGPQDRERAKEMDLPFPPEDDIIVYCH